MAGNHTLAPSTSSMNLPRSELTKFDGSSHDYLKFIRQFEFHQKWAEYFDGVTKDERKLTFRGLRNFMDIRARISNSRFGTIADQTNKCRAAQATLPKQPIKRQHSSVYAVFKTTESCLLCSEPHPLTNGVKFAESECSERLGAGHVTKACNTERKCGVNECKARHYYLLHTAPNPSRSVKGNCNASNARQVSTAFSLLLVRIKGPLGKLVVYALLDNGSDTTLVSHDVLRKLGIPPHPSQLTIKTISGICLSESCVENLEIGFPLDSTWANIEKAFVVPRIMPSLRSDDCLLSVPSIDAARMISAQLTEMLLKAGFHLRAWATNAPEAMENLFSAEGAESPLTLPGCNPTMHPNLDTQWDILRDEFCFQYDIPR
ncbi:hypothetical protein X801_02893 [Opisthorchis viverrini]|uniref:Peptidase aspartic putative domain-containing protein n=1 Tax=Opisthorchis viverrini TaxID=6198 RepID=A0A1S8X3G4_OPIVI|nr:hypothetical protein X801_02893 [Opisthorchis viverrini]